jgi:hypothetical protein
MERKINFYFRFVEAVAVDLPFGTARPEAVCRMLDSCRPFINAA